MTAASSILGSVLKRKITTFLFIGVGVCAFATLGDGNSKSKKKRLLSNKYSSVTPGKFSLKSGYQYRGSQIISQNKSNNTISLNSVLTYQKGHTTYILPLKTRLITDKFKFTVGVPQLNNQ